MISAPLATVSAWRNESARLLAVATRTDLPDDVKEAITHAASLFMASWINASPGVPALFQADLRRLVGPIEPGDGPDLAQAAGIEEGAPCPLPRPDGKPVTCTCGEEARETCASIARDLGMNPDQIGEDLDALVVDDRRAQRDGDGS